MRHLYNSSKSIKRIGPVVYQHPAEIIEPELIDEDVKAVAEAFNTIEQWVFGVNDIAVIGRRAICICACASREKIPRRGLFRSVENDRAERMLKMVLVTILGILVDPSDFTLTGRKTIAAFHLMRKEILGARTLTEVGKLIGCKKQAIAQSQKRFLKKLGEKLATPPRKRRAA